MKKLTDEERAAKLVHRAFEAAKEIVIQLPPDKLARFCNWLEALLDVRRQDAKRAEEKQGALKL